MTTSTFATYISSDGRKWRAEDAWIPPAIGQGVIDEGGNRYRVVDVWVNFERRARGVGDPGIYVYVEAATGQDDRPGNLHPDYYAQQD